MTYAIRIHETGGPEVLRFEEVDVPKPAPDEVLLRHTAVGVNFIDIYHRTGLYPLPRPAVLGSEGAGVVEAVGADVRGISVGDRVAYAQPVGAYAQRRVMPAWRVVRLPQAVPDEVAAAIMLKGMTAEYLLRRTFPVAAGHQVLVHSAAGGVGTLLCGWARALGARVVGTVGSKDKVPKAQEAGCHDVVVRGGDWAEQVRGLTGGKGVDVVYDSIGRDTFLGSLNALRPRGMLVSFGQSSGVIPPVDVQLLSQKGSLFLTRPTLGAYTATRDEVVQSAEALFDALAKGWLHARVTHRFPLKDAAKAHALLESGVTTGSIVLVP